MMETYRSNSHQGLDVPLPTASQILTLSLYRIHSAGDLYGTTSPLDMDYGCGISYRNQRIRSNRQVLRQTPSTTRLTRLPGLDSNGYGYGDGLRLSSKTHDWMDGWMDECPSIANRRCTRSNSFDLLARMSSTDRLLTCYPLGSGLAPLGPSYGFKDGLFILLNSGVV